LLRISLKLLATKGEEAKMIKKIVEIAKDEITESSCSTVDLKTKFFVDLLEKLGYEKESLVVYNHYEKVWGDQ